MTVRMRKVLAIPRTAELTTEFGIVYFLPALVLRYFPWGLKVSEALFVQKKLLLGVCYHVIRVVTKKLK